MQATRGRGRHVLSAGLLKNAKHTFQVRAVDTAGNVDPTPATRTWKVKEKKRK